MGQPLPLPERIPKPSPKDETELNQMGITIGESETKYVTYTMPEGWRMVDDSWREDLPEFYILDTEDMKRVSIYGQWKGYGSDRLRLSIIDEPDKYVKPDTDVIEESETSNANLVAMFAASIDPFNRPAVEAEVTRDPDFRT